MRTIFASCLGLLLFVLVGCAGPDGVKTRKGAKEFNEFGKTRTDDYYWLNNPKDSSVIAHLREENSYTETMLKHTEGMQKKIFDELVARIDQKYTSLPTMSNGYWYYIRYEEGKQYPLYCRRKGTMTSAEEVMLDVPSMAQGHQIFMVRGYEVSPRANLVAYGIDTTGDRRCALYIKDLATGALAPEVIDNTSAEYAWAKDGKSLFYAINDPTVRPYKVFRHVLGTAGSADKEIYAEKDSTYGVGLSTTRDNKYIFITSGSIQTTENWMIPADRPETAPVVIQPRVKDVLYGMEDYEGDNFFIHTNKDAKNFRLVSTPIRKPGMASWVDVIPHRTDALLQEAAVYRRYIVAQQKINGLSQILVIDRKSGTSHYVHFDEDAFVASWWAATDSYDLDSIRYTYTSMTTPRSEYLYHLDTREASLLKREKIGGGYDPAPYVTTRIWAPASDGVKIPISIVYKKELLRKDGSNPCFLYAYGSYGASMEPAFNSSIISLLDRGFVYAIAHVRGGQEMGRWWYEDGKLFKKKNTFTDFVASAEFLVKEKYTSSHHLFINGGSAGGMLMGAVTNMRPDLFRGVIAEVPWMDVVSDMLNPDLPLTTLEYEEWGNPYIKDQYDYMLSWSPYDNVRDAKYPAILSTGGLNDTQVPYFSPAKWVAKVREHNTGSNIVLFKCNMGAGHSGESGRFERQKLTALKYAWVLDLAGIQK
jgi:oligopeptidase B